MSREICSWCGEAHFANPLAPEKWDCRGCDMPNITTETGVIRNPIGLRPAKPSAALPSCE